MGGLVDRMTDTLIAHGCGDSDQCEKTARALLQDLLYPPLEIIAAGEANDLAYAVENIWNSMIEYALKEDSYA